MRVNIKILLIIGFCLLNTYQLSCVDEVGKPMDWWVILKHPSGTEFSYFDKESHSAFEPYKDLNDIKQSPLLRTVSQIKNLKSSSYASLFWNDQSPDGSEHSTYAHQKGILGADKTSGFIIIHSFPKYPSFNGQEVNVEIQQGQQIYGQHALCISMNTLNIEKYADIMLIDRPFIFSESYIPPQLQTIYKELYKLSNNRNYNPLSFGNLNFKSIGGQNFIKFAKNKQYENAFYKSVVASYFKKEVVTETWGNGEEGLMDPNCDDPKVLSNLEIQFDHGVSYSYQQDHSKYAIVTGSNYVCLGDINRQLSQINRGGGTVCFNEPQVYTLFNKLMTRRQTCKNTINKLE